MDYSYYPDSNPPPYSLYGLHNAPTPQNQGHSQTLKGNIEDGFPLNNYNAFDPSLRFDNSLVLPHSPPESFSKRSNSSNDPVNIPCPGEVDGTAEDLFTAEIPAAGRSTSTEEKDGILAPPGTSRRKEQNRAAQRAFRERNKRHVSDLQDQVSSLEKASTSLQLDNERLKQELARYTTENEILRATSQTHRGPPSPSSTLSHTRSYQDEPTTTGPMKFTPTDFFSNLVPPGEPVRRHKLTNCSVTGEKLLDAGSTWDLIQDHELVKHGAVDLGAVCEMLRRGAQCDGQGPAFPESLVKSAVEECVVGNDELI
ncbi:B-zip transcription factor [Aspergillus sclerotialis]|uniref:B-zip transcription factor n=1 Tax=Aspergillus sclerotialis TaxID=2070753 RepID=A0A3A2ZN08_9EURO|nr:B-zip transcription factor [Aspergillus sclerotialis]